MLRGIVALITGASSGLGKALAIKLAEKDVNLVLASRNEEMLHKTKEEITKRNPLADNKILIIPADITKTEDCKNLVQSSAAHFGSIDFLILNAGISMWSPFEEIKDLSVYQRLMETNYMGAVYCTYFALPYLKKSSGEIIVIDSIQGKIAVPNHTGYVASKHALIGFFDTLRMEVEKDGVNVLNVLPHWIRGTKLRENSLDASGEHSLKADLQHSSESIDVEECAVQIINSMGKRKRELIIPFKLKMLTWINAFFPRLAEKIIMSKVEEQKNNLLTKDNLTHHY
jgi:short-subunit dehydrogenase